MTSSTHILGRFEDHFHETLQSLCDPFVVTDAPVDLNQYQWDMLFRHPFPVLVFAGLKGADSLRKKILAIDRACGRPLTQWGLPGDSPNLAWLLYSTEEDPKLALHNVYHLSEEDHTPDPSHPYSLSVSETLAAMSQSAFHVELRGKTIVDPFAGVGTTLLAAKRMGLDSIGIEMDQDYHAISKHRLNG